MPRLARVIVPGFPHYLTQHARAGQTLFPAENDYRLYLDLTVKNSRRYGVRLLGFCLLPNRIGWVAIPNDDRGLALAFGRAHSEYAQASGRKMWRDRFDSRALDYALGWRAVLYIERWPVSNGLVEMAEQWRWSSAATHIGQPGPIELDLDGWRALFNGETWETILEVGLGEDGLAQRLKRKDVRTALRPAAAVAPA